MARLPLWFGGTCDLEVDAIVNSANVTLRTSSGSARATAPGGRS